MVNYDYNALHLSKIPVFDIQITSKFTGFWVQVPEHGINTASSLNSCSTVVGEVNILPKDVEKLKLNTMNKNRAFMILDQNSLTINGNGVGLILSSSFLGSEKKELIH